MAGTRAKPQHRTRRYVLTALLSREDGEFVVTVAQLPGVVTEASNEAEALERIAEATSGALEVYLEAHEQIPWATPEEAGEAAGEADQCLAFTVEIDG